MRRMILALVAALSLNAGAAFAGGGERGDWELGLYGGYGWLDDYVWLQPKDDILYGARLGYFFTSNWSVEASAQRLPTEKDTVATPNINMELDALRLNVLYNFAPGNRIRPFLTGGANYEITDVEDIGESYDWGWNVGGGLRMFLNPTWCLRADARYVSVNVHMVGEDTESNVEGTLGLSVLFGGGDAEPAAVIQANQRPSVSCASERQEVLPGESVRLQATAADPDGDPLSYEWSTTGGRVVGSGATATLDFTGATPPASATVTVRVSDGRGNTASSDCAVRLITPARQAEAVSCLAGGFPRNLSRLTNVDKACLDDVVQRLKADPRARVIVVGHADSRESAPGDIAEQRAAAVNAYLVSAGIESTRISNRSAGATSLLDTGTGVTAQGRNRRVEVWFVPEGAREPE